MHCNKIKLQWRSAQQANPMARLGSVPVSGDAKEEEEKEEINDFIRQYTSD
jgi:hypothetical protein